MAVYTYQLLACLAALTANGKLVGLLTALLFAPIVEAAAPCVQFDVSDSVACRDVTPPEFELLNPDEKLVEVRFHVSSLIHYGFDGELFQYLYVVQSPEQRLRIVDCFPKTEMSSDITGMVKVEQDRLQTSGIELHSTGGVEEYLGASVSAQAGRKSSARVQYEMLPPMGLLAASGTTHRGSGAYFKLKPSPRVSLEGTKEFALILRVPRGWRGDYLQVYCAAFAAPPGPAYLGLERPVCGAGNFVVPLYLEGDQQAKQIAQQYVQHERQLRAMAVSHGQQIAKRRYPSLGHKLAALVDLAEPKIPRTWLDQVLASRSESMAADFRQYLPDEVNRAINEFLTARQQLRRLGEPALMDEMQPLTYASSVPEEK